MFRCFFSCNIYNIDVIFTTLMLMSKIGKKMEKIFKPLRLPTTNQTKYTNYLNLLCLKCIFKLLVSLHKVNEKFQKILTSLLDFVLVALQALNLLEQMTEVLTNVLIMFILELECCNLVGDDSIHHLQLKDKQI